MKPGLGRNKDFLAGLFFLVIGALAVSVARDYPMGSAMRMGPGYFPTVLGGILVLFGIFLTLRGIARGVRFESEWGWRPLAAIALSIVLFGFLMSRAGLIPALAATLFVSALGGREFRLKEALVLSALMSAFAVGVFVYGLKLPYRLLAGL
ncbi:MAG: tripartite tricarboxylate transporter TctB family protein [Burkholderiales bacterium]